MNNLRLASLATLLAAASLAACTTNGTYATTNHQHHRAAAMDADTAARVRAMILVDERITLRKTVTVNFRNGTAELLGEARNSEERALAQEVALRTPGVRQVSNLLTIR
ncbi:BON domain-containing protein [Simplicispira lacusdiani]|uniref:BON domain-containing protein n=1 Tax=Simplicispira lacusdiani TaxID=2213010 RepID=UPI0013008F42|nr:BON domain-containing protein [Simplicispira lacusdiani]